MRKPIVAIQKDDDKSRMWALAGRGTGLEMVPVPGSPIAAPFHYLRLVAHGRRPAVLCTRYLNDYPGKLKTLLRLFSELLLLGLCRAGATSVLWICHNADRETDCHHPRLSQLRRKLMSRAADRIAVLDPLLIEPAQRSLGVSASKFCAISFGHPPSSASSEPASRLADLEARIVAGRNRATDNGLIPLVTLCLSTPRAQKTLHYDYLVDLLDAAKRCGYWLIAITGGDFSGSGRPAMLARKFREHDQIIFAERRLDLPRRFVEKHVDFYWRGYADNSVPYSLYEASALGKPTLAYDAGALPQLIRRYSLGSVVDRDFGNVEAALVALAECCSGSYARFLDNRSWASLAHEVRRLLDRGTP